jgi:hypothetical protein
MQFLYIGSALACFVSAALAGLAAYRCACDQDPAPAVIGIAITSTLTVLAGLAITFLLP